MSNKKTILLVLLIFLFSPTVYANVVWSALYVESYMLSIPIISLSLLIELLFFKRLFNLSFKNAVYYTFTANFVSTLLGVILLPFSGIAWEVSPPLLILLFLLNWGTFNPVTWFSVPIIGGAINAFIELLTIKQFWKQPINKRKFFLTWIINAITVGIATVWVIADSYFGITHM